MSIFNSIIQGRGNTVTINGKRYHTSGNNSSIIVNGSNVQINTGETIEIGDIEITNENDMTLKIIVKGDAKSVKTVSGDVSVEGNVLGSVSTVSGDVDAGGSISGAVSTISGDIKPRR